MPKMKRIWVAESFAKKLKKDAANYNTSMLNLTKELAKEEQSINYPTFKTKRRGGHGFRL